MCSAISEACGVVSSVPVNLRNIGEKYWVSLVAQMVKNLLARDSGWIPGLGPSLGEGNGYPLQYSYLENSMDRAIWQAIVHEVTKSQT